MTTTIRNYQGTALTTAKIIEISEKLSMKSAIHKLPGADKDYIQSLGASNKVFTIKGIVTTSSEDTFLYTLVRNTGSLIFSSSAFGQPINTQVFFLDVDLQDKGSRPLERTFMIRAIEVL